MFVRSSMETLPRSDNNEFSLSARTNQIRKIGGLGIVDLQELGIKGFQLVESPRLASRSAVSRAIISSARCNNNHVAVLSHIEALGRHDNIERLIPGYVPQTQGYVTLNGIRDTTMLRPDVSASKLQYRACLDILEVKGQTLAVCIPWSRRTGSLAQYQRPSGLISIVNSLSD